MKRPMCQVLPTMEESEESKRAKMSSAVLRGQGGSSCGIHPSLPPSQGGAAELRGCQRVWQWMAVLLQMVLVWEEKQRVGA